MAGSDSICVGKSPIRLVPDAISRDTVQVLEASLLEARVGKIIGLAFAAMCKNRTYIVNTAGEAFRNPTFTRGMIAALDDKLSDMSRK